MYEPKRLSDICYTTHPGGKQVNVVDIDRLSSSTHILCNSLTYGELVGLIFVLTNERLRFVVQDRRGMISVEGCTYSHFPSRRVALYIRRGLNFHIFEMTDTSLCVTAGDTESGLLPERPCIRMLIGRIQNSVKFTMFPINAISYLCWTGYVLVRQRDTYQIDPSLCISAYIVLQEFAALLGCPT